MFVLFYYLERHASDPEKFPVHSSEFELHPNVSSYARMAEQQATYYLRMRFFVLKNVENTMHVASWLLSYVWRRG
jgi:hypothetical protein